MAVENSVIDFRKEDPYKMGVFVGTAIGGGDVIEVQHSIFMEKGVRRIAPFSVVSISTHSASAIIGCEFNLRGPNTTVASGCNTGLDATYLAYNTILAGDADVIVVGAGESPVTPYIQALFGATGFLSSENQEPSKAIKPYSAKADGMVLGEGGACIILEELQHALEREANIYAEITGYSALNEAFDLIEVSPDNGTMSLNFRQALKRSSVDIAEVDYISAHGNGILSYDISETNAIKEVFGELAYNIPVTSIKPNAGHSISTTGIFQIITSLLAIKHGVIPPTMNVEEPAPECDLNYVPGHFLKKEVKTALVNVHGFGGRITALVVRRFQPTKFVS
jgi:3-oxoacyl-[acyl-carrier-protein] synthase II